MWGFIFSVDALIFPFVSLVGWLMFVLLMASHVGLYRLHATMKAIYCKYQKNKKTKIRLGGLFNIVSSCI